MSFLACSANSSAKAVFMSTKVRDLKEFGVGLEVAVCRSVSPYSCACSGCCLAEQWHKTPILVKVLDGNAQNVWLCMLMCLFSPLGSADVCVMQKCCWIKFCFW